MKTAFGKKQTQWRGNGCLRKETQLSARAAVPAPGAEIGGGVARLRRDEETVSATERTTNFIKPQQLRLLAKLIDALAEDNDRKTQYYILIDELDEDWVDSGIKYALLNALFEAIKKFRPLRDMKIIIAIRSDVLEKSMKENKAAGFQRESLADFITEIEWKDGKLKELIDKRLTAGFRKKYSPQQDVVFKDIFPPEIETDSSFSYLLERTLERPRDIIAFVNCCLAQAEAKNTVSAADIAEAEEEYSLSRKEALIDEWKLIYPNIAVIISVLQGADSVFTIKSFLRARAEQAENFISGFIDIKEEKRGGICRRAIKVFEKSEAPSFQDRADFLRCVFAALYHIGAVGIELEAGKGVQYSFINRAEIEENLIQDVSRIHVSKMLHRALGIKLRRSKMQSEIPAYLSAI